MDEDGSPLVRLRLGRWNSVRSKSEAFCGRRSPLWLGNSRLPGQNDLSSLSPVAIYFISSRVIPCSWIPFLFVYTGVILCTLRSKVVDSLSDGKINHAFMSRSGSVAQRAFDSVCRERVSSWEHRSRTGGAGGGPCHGVGI